MADSYQISLVPVSLGLDRRSRIRFGSVVVCPQALIELP